MILLLHNRYRVPGGEERAVEDMAWLIREHLGEEVEVLERDSSALSQRDAAEGLLRGGLAPEEVGEAVRRTGARVVHAHNVNPTLGWRALAAAREAGARVVLHLHNYRLVCAVGTCFTHGEDCTRCHGRNTLPGVRLNCRGGSPAESAAYAASLALWQGRIADQADRFLVPSAFALRRLRELGAPVDDRASVLWSVQREFASASRAAEGRHVLYAGRLSHEKGVADAVAACRDAGLPLVVAGDGPASDELRELAAGADVQLHRQGRLGSARRAAPRRRRRGRPVALRGDPAARRARGDGGRSAGRRGTLGRSRRARTGGGPVSARRRRRARSAPAPAVGRRRRPASAALPSCASAARPRRSRRRSRGLRLVKGRRRCAPS